MADEIERKFLVHTAPDLSGYPSERIAQTYLSAGLPTVRVRIKGEQGFLTIKGPSVGISRKEYEYEIPLADAEEMLALPSFGRVDKLRYYIPAGRHLLELDVFQGVHAGLVLAEVELKSADEMVVLPNWVGEEVSTDARYYNSSIAQAVYKGGSLVLR